MLFLQQTEKTDWKQEKPILLTNKRGMQSSQGLICAWGVIYPERLHGCAAGGWISGCRLCVDAGVNRLVWHCVCDEILCCSHDRHKNK